MSRRHRAIPKQDVPEAMKLVRRLEKILEDEKEEDEAIHQAVKCLRTAVQQRNLDDYLRSTDQIEHLMKKHAEGCDCDKCREVLKKL